MAIAQSYPKGTPKLTDTVIGVQYEENKEPAVKQFGINDILELNPVINTELPYKIYVALLTQTEASPPEATILQNTLYGIPVWSYIDEGVYEATLENAFTNLKTTATINNGYDASTGNNANFAVDRPSVNSIRIFNSLDGLSSDNMLGAGNNSVIEIRVYN